jgi:predicted permease
MGFSVVFLNVLIMLLFLSCGFALVKAGKCDVSHAKSFSGFLLYICGPAMVISAFQSMEYAAEDFGKIAAFFVTTLLIQLLFFAILYILLHRKYADAKYRILTVGAILGNVGFFGLPVVTALFPEEPIAACYSSMYVISMNLLVFTVGVFLITNKRKYMSLKSALLNPTTIAVLIALPLYLLRIQLPEFLGNAVALLGKMTTPLCMLILGMRLTTIRFKALFTRPFAYTVCLLKLIVFPLFAYLSVYFLPCFDATFRISLLVLSAAPSAAIILSLAELHGCEQELSANVALLTTLLSIATIPLLLLIV